MQVLESVFYEPSMELMSVYSFFIYQHCEHFNEP